MATPEDETETELELEFFISHILRIGVLFVAVVIGFGVLLWVLKDDSGYSGSTYPILLVTIVRDAVALRPLAVIQMGLVLLVLTPVVRVAASLFLFARGHDWTYVIITGIVFTLLLISLFLGSGE